MLRKDVIGQAGVLRKGVIEQPGSQAARRARARARVCVCGGDRQNS